MTETISSRLSSVLGATSIVIGNINGSGDLEIRGKVQGNINTEGRILISEGATVLGNVEATSLEVAGEVRGNLSAQDGLQIATSGQVIGQINAPRVGIEAGAIVRGQLTTGRIDPARTKDFPVKPTDQLLSTEQLEVQTGGKPKGKRKSPTNSSSLQHGETPFEGSAKSAPALVDFVESEGTQPGQQPTTVTPPDNLPRPPRKRRRKPRTRTNQAESQSPTEKDNSAVPPAQLKIEKSVEDAPNTAATTEKPVKLRPQKVPTKAKSGAIKSTQESAPRGVKKSVASPPKIPTFTKGTKGHRRTLASTEKK